MWYTKCECTTCAHAKEGALIMELSDSCHCFAILRSHRGGGLMCFSDQKSAVTLHTDLSGAFKFGALGLSITFTKQNLAST